MSDYYILDSSVILSNPEVLAWNPVEKLLIPDLVVEEIKKIHPKFRMKLLTLIKLALAKGAISASTPDAPLISKTTALLYGDLSITDASIADIALDYSNKHRKKITVVTEDKYLIKLLSDIGVSTLSADEFISITSKTVADVDLIASINAVRTVQKKLVLFSFLGGFLVAILGIIIIHYLDKIVSTISIWGILIALVAAGLLLYLYRERARFSYGIFEFFIGLLTTYFIFPASFDYSKLAQSEIFQIIAGLYVMVRGLDNIGKALEGTPSEKTWKRIFSGK